METRGNRLGLYPMQIKVLTAAADGAPLSQVAQRVGIPREKVGSHLSDIYRRLDLGNLPRNEKRAEAIRIARARGILTKEETR